MEDASEDVTSELLDALLSGTNSKRLEELASTWRHAQTPKLLAAVCGLRFPPFPKEDELLRGAASTVLALQVALAKLLDSAVKPGAQGPSPLLGTLQTLPPQGARQVMTRISKLYSVVVGMLVSAESKCLGDPLLELLAQLQLISGTPLRSLRQAASAAALGALQALLAERHVARGALAELETQKRALMDAAGDAAAAARLARLCRGTAQLEALTQQMDVEVGKMQERVLLPRLQDTAAILRRFTLNALGRYMQLKFLWTPERILQGFFDPAPEVRLQAIEIAGAWFEGDLDDPALVREAASHLAERSRDSEPRVSAAALRHLRHPVLVSQLSDDDFARVANLALTAPDSHGLLRVEAALFVEQHLLPEPGLGIAAKKQPGEEGDDLERHFITEHGLMAVADFLTSYLPENDQLHLSRRFVEALWLRTAFRRWSALADLCLLGEGQGAARGVPCLPTRQRLALLVVLDAALKCAEVPGDATEALLPRLPRLFELFTAEGLCFLDVLASISRRLICAACQKDEALPRALLVALLSALRTRRSGVHAMLQLAEALVAWAERSSEVQTATRQLVLDLYSSLSLQLSSPTSELSQVLGPLLALGHRGVDLWTCDEIGLGNKIFGSALSILEASDGQQPEGEAVPTVSPRVAAELLQLLTLLSCWRARCLLGEASKENSGFLMWCHLIRASCSKVYNDSPCAVLGLQGPVTSSGLNKAFRELSKCTHPDRLRGRLKRSPSKEESRRGEIIFNRASAAKDELFKTQKNKKVMQCYQGEMEMAVLLLFQQVGRIFVSLGIEDYMGFFWELVWNLITFEAGILNTLLCLLWLSFVYKILRQFGGYLWRMGILRFALGFVTTVVIGPFPTLFNFLALPLIRIYVFAQSLVAENRSEPDETAAVGATSTQEEPEPQPNVHHPSTAAVKVATDKDVPRNLRQRKKKETDEAKEARNKALLNGDVQAASGTEDANAKPKPVPEGLWQVVTWGNKEPVKARQAAASAMQFDILLILTKPVIPLIMLVALGQVWNGLFSSLFIGHALRKWVPQMSYEAHHLLCALFGTLHTLLGVSASKLEDYANREGSKILHLAWAWSFKDVLSVMHMCQLGAAVTAMSALGNEPSYAASFASGIALRIAVGQDAFRGLGFVHALADYFQGTLKDLGISLDAADEVVAYSGGGIGDCGGGPFRMLFGDETYATIAATVLKAWLLLLPVLSTAQWFQRTCQAGRLLGKRWKFTRFVQRLILFLLGVLQICLFASSELNASNGALINYWLAMLFGCAGESLMSTYDIRGPVRQIIFLLLFLFM